MELKYVVEIEIPEEKLAQLKTNPVGLTIDDLVTTKIESALGPLCNGALLVYKSEEGKQAIDRYKICPVCNHPWPMHFNTIDSEGKLLHPPKPAPCSVCAPENRCMESTK
jgi:hypothetical protein